jgi:hypothetical protein
MKVYVLFSALEIREIELSEADYNLTTGFDQCLYDCFSPPFSDWRTMWLDCNTRTSMSWRIEPDCNNFDGISEEIEPFKCIFASIKTGSAFTLRDNTLHVEGFGELKICLNVDNNNPPHRLPLPFFETLAAAKAAIAQYLIQSKKVQSCLQGMKYIIAIQSGKNDMFRFLERRQQRNLDRQRQNLVMFIANITKNRPAVLHADDPCRQDFNAYLHDLLTIQCRYDFYYLLDKIYHAIKLELEALFACHKIEVKKIRFVPDYVIHSRANPNPLKFILTLRDIVKIINYEI